jgi:hypothetical protein
MSVPLKIGYLGNVNEDRIESLRMLASIINKNPGEFRLCYFTSQTERFLENMGVFPVNSTINFFPDDIRLLEELKLCDIFFLPMTPSCHSAREEQSITGFPTKLLDYFLSQRPVLVHSPDNYYAALFCRKHSCGYVVDGDIDELLHALRRLSHEKELRINLVENALKTISIFNGVGIANRFRDLLTS